MAYTYDLVKLHAQVRDLLPPKARFAITLQVWDGGALGLEAEVRLYHDGNHYVGDMPDQALAKMRREVRGRPELQPEDLGLVVMPEGAEVAP